MGFEATKLGSDRASGGLIDDAEAENMKFIGIEDIVKVLINRNLFLFWHDDGNDHRNSKGAIELQQRRKAPKYVQQQQGTEKLLILI